MSDLENQDAAGVVNAFLVGYLDDQERGGVRPLQAYLDDFPGYEEAITSKYRELEAVTEERARGAATTGTWMEPTGVAGAPAEQVGPYKLVERLGEGGMGTVYLAEQTGALQRCVALKRIKLGMDTKEVIARFEAERQALARMSHRNIARVFDAGTSSDGRPYFVMEYVSGVPLTTFCDTQGAGITERLELFLQITDGVHHAHQKGIIHRDLKPSNVLVSLENDTPVPKIIDFGIAKSLTQPLVGETVFTQLGQRIGTPAYMSPEQIESAGSDIDTRADIYALGVVLYELLTGVWPFRREELREIDSEQALRRLLENTPPRASTRVNTLPEEESEAIATRRGLESRSLVRLLRGDLDWITAKALEKDPARRYASASEFGADIQRFLRHEPVLAGPPTLAYRVYKGLRRHRRGLGVAAAMLLLLGVGVAINDSLAMRDRREDSRTEFRLGQGAWERYGRHNGDLRELERRWSQERQRLETWEPVWKRKNEHTLWSQLEVKRQEISEAYSAALISFYRAFEGAPPGTPEKQLAYREIRRLHAVDVGDWLAGPRPLPPEFFSILLRDPSLDAIHQEFDDREALRLASEPAGAEVYCFRYGMREGRLFPLPYDPSRGVVGDGFLQVDRVWTRAGAERPPFQPGDRLQTVRGREVRLLGDLLAALRGVGAGSAIPATVRRAETTRELSWTPFESFVDVEQIDSTRKQLGLTFEGYPLDFQACGPVGRTPLSIDLESGSYLFVLRHPEFDDARVPVVLPRLVEASGRVHHVRLFRHAEIPPGFVHVAAGYFASGGDPKVHQSLAPTNHRVKDFFMRRLEVTVGEYAEFLNAEDNREWLRDDGTAEPRTAWARARLREFPGERMVVVPVSRSDGGLLYEKVAGRWVSRAEKGFGSSSWPVLSVPILAAVEYAAWLSRKHGEQWTFRLPTDLEWEKAARGVDRRFFVWGDYPTWSFCRTRKGTRPGDRAADVVGAYPMDESVYGVRDLAGSASEPTTDITEEYFRSVRGGNWYANDGYFVRIANRNGSYPHSVKKIDQGIRLVAEPPRPLSGR